MKSDIEAFYENLSNYFNFHVHLPILTVAFYKRQHKLLCETRMQFAKYLLGRKIIQQVL
jgi:hypothetical protein